MTVDAASTPAEAPAFDPEAISVVTASQLKVILCHACGLVCREPPAEAECDCPRCGTSIHRRTPHSVARTWALLIAAAILYIPANLLPIMFTHTLGDNTEATIMQGVFILWEDGSWDLALIVFVASIMVPMLKLVSLMLLLVSVQRKSTWRQVDRTRLYRLLELIGHWSMLDVFVVGLLVSLVQFGSFAQVEARPGVIAFCTVVILTMLASMSFDPRLIWDPQHD